MASLSDHCRAVLAGIITAPDTIAQRTRLARAWQMLPLQHFRDPALRAIFDSLHRYHEQTGGILKPPQFEDILRQLGTDAGKTAHYVAILESLGQEPVAEPEFIHGIALIKDEHADMATREAIYKALETIQRGSTRRELADDGQWVAVPVRGHQAAREGLYGDLLSIERASAAGYAPEVDLVSEAASYLSTYAERRLALRRGETGAKFGLNNLDKVFGGIRPGELCIIAGGSGDGKTDTLIQLAWNAVVNQGLNVYFGTVELALNQVQDRFVSRHSCHEGFSINDPSGYPGIDSRQLRDGTLTPLQIAGLKETLRDLKSNPAYGSLYIQQVNPSSTVPHLTEHLRRIESSHPWRGKSNSIDLVIIDYLMLLSGTAGREQHERYSSVIRSAKHLAAAFGAAGQEGRGVPVISPWQLNRSGLRDFKSTGLHDLNSLAGTSEVGNSPDIVIVLSAARPDLSSRKAEVKYQVLKNRSGPGGSSIELDLDYATARFSERIVPIISDDDFLSSH